MSLSTSDTIKSNGYHSPNLLSNENDDFVITGVSGRFPEANSIDEFAYNLFNGIDMVTANDRRWPEGQYGLPTRNGKLKEVDRFDAAFFNVHPKQAHNMDPQLRLLLEVTYESICDAGMNPAKLKGTKTGVFIGASGSDAQTAFSSDPQTLEGYSMTGCATSMFANRLSFFFDFKGPSYTVDTACSSSLLALDCALNALRTGACDAAIVGGVNLCFRPQTSLQFLKLQMLSADGACRAFDSSGTGYVRSETVATVFIQKRQDAKRLYATVLHSKTNTDGWKKDGITFPSGQMQKTLLENIYNEIHLDPNSIGYVEAHGTGTRAGDPQEMNSITEVFCSKRKQPLLIGSTKSNMGHPEPASGVAALAKLLVAIQDGHIPANLHYKSPNTDIPGLTDGRLKVVTEKTELPNNLIAINSFGFGGANVHAVLEANLNRTENENPSRNEVRLAFACARTADGCENTLKRLKESETNIELQALVTENSYHPSHTHPYRGFTLLNSSESTTTVKKSNNERRPIWFIFSGMGTQWSGMGRDLMELKLFRQSIERSSIVLKKYDIDLFKLILSSTPSDLDKPINSFVSIAAIQVALVDSLKAMGVEPDGIVGHSVGELGCAYADGCFSAEETILAAYFRGKCIQEANLPPGGMAAVGLTWAECKEMCPSDIAPACHNAVDTVTISGPKDSIAKFVEELKEKKIFAKEVACNQVAFHSHYMMEIAPLLRKCLENILDKPSKQRSAKWISSSVPEEKWNTPLALTSSPDYHVNNLCSPVLFQEALQKIPTNAITLELAPHCLLLAIIKRSLSTDCIHLNLMKRGTHDHVNYFYTNLGKLYNEGVNINIMLNYEAIQYPVPVNVPFISPLIASQWDHSQQWKIPTFEMFTQSLGSAQQAKHEIDLNVDSEYAFIIGHQIDGRCLFPATGYLVLVWKTFAKLNNYEDYRQMSVLFEQVQIHRATICSLTNKVIFYVNILPTNGTFEIIENNTIVVTGKISLSEQLTMQKFHQQNPVNSTEKNLQTNEIYRDFNLRGYEYSGLFRGINQINIEGTSGELKWNNDWISYLDTMLQVHLIPTQGLQLPTRIDSLRIDPKFHLESISSSTSTCSVYVDYWNSLCFSGGVELFGLHCTGTSKKNKQQNTILESYLFVPFEKQENLENELETCLYLILENTLSTTLSLCQIGNEKLSDEIWNFYSQQPSIKSLEYTLVTSLSPDEINQKKINIIENLSLTSTLVDLVIVNQTENWEKLFSLSKSNGFLLLSSDIDIPTDQLQTANFLPIAQRKNYQLWKKFSNENLTDTIVNLDEKNFQWVEQIKTLLANSSSQRVWLVSNQLDNGILGFFNCLRREPGGQSLRAVQIQNSKNVLNDNVWKTLKTRDLAVNIYQNDVWGSYVHQHLQTSNNSAWVETDNAHVNVLNRGDLSSLTWLESPVITTVNANDPNSDTCTVHYASLNFRDIMLATGKLSPEAIPGYLKMQGCLLGLEFAGLDSAGQRVMGLLSAKGLATRVAIDKRYSWRVPENWTLEQASTIPVVYATAYYALIVRGQLKRGEKVLIHAGTGGVGTAAIAIAYSYDCEVFTTVSSTEKREYLKKLFPRLNDEHIANSRDTTFEQQIRFVTKGKGVDVVLNSLAEDKLQASVRLLAQHGRFLEIGKFDLSQNNPLGMSIFLKNTTFHGILLDSLFENANEDWLRVHQLVEQGIQNGVVGPLQSNVFNANEIEQAFRFMSQGKHMGKVVIKVYDESRPLVRAIRKTWFSPNKTYIITGGLGGFGLELTEWLVERGARNLILCSRSGIRTGYQLKKITYLQTFFDAQISISKLNITDEKECEELIAKNSLPIGGIFHLAAVLQDGLFENLTADLFNEVVDIKYHGTKYLDQYTRKYSEKTLDYFVVFSSISCGRGNAGQTNYGYANSTMERICEQRQKDGLPALAIQWGAIGDVGMVIENLGSNDTVVGGTLPQRMTSCLETIDYFLQQSQNLPVVSSYVLAEKLQKTSGSGETSASLIETIANILGITDASTMSADSTLADLGLDSLGSVEIKQLLEQKYSVSLANSKEIQQLTVKRLKEIDLSSSLSSSVPTTTTTAPTNKTETKISSVLPSIDLSQWLPKDLLVLLNEKMQGNKYEHLFLIHPIEGHVEMLRELAQFLPITVFGLQSTNDVPDTSIEDIAAYYIKKIIEIQPTGPYLIGGYSFGACIAVEISLQLPSIEQLLLLDGSHSYVATHTKQYRTKFNEPKHAEAAVLYAFLLQFIPNLDQKKTLSDLSNLPSYEDRLQFAADLLDKTINIGVDNIILVAKRFHNKLLLAENYVPSKKIQCQTTLFRVQTASEYSQTIGDDYGLSTVCQSPVQVVAIPGDHRTFLQGENVKILAEQIRTVTSNSS